MILKLNTKVREKTTDEKNNGGGGFGKVFGGVATDWIIYLINLILVTTFINGRNWCFFPVIGFDNSDESFTYKNWVNCVVNPDNNLVVADSSWDGLSGPLEVTTENQYYALASNQEDLRDDQKKIFAFEALKSRTPDNTKNLDDYSNLKDITGILNINSKPTYQEVGGLLEKAYQYFYVPETLKPDPQQNSSNTVKKNNQNIIKEIDQNIIKKNDQNTIKMATHPGGRN